LRRRCNRLPRRARTSICIIATRVADVIHPILLSCLKGGIGRASRCSESQRSEEGEEQRDREEACHLKLDVVVVLKVGLCLMKGGGKVVPFAIR
jgi:hypothetical protein